MDCTAEPDEQYDLVMLHVEGVTLFDKKSGRKDFILRLKYSGSEVNMIPSHHNLHSLIPFDC